MNKLAASEETWKELTYFHNTSEASSLTLNSLNASTRFFERILHKDPI